MSAKCFKAASVAVFLSRCWQTDCSDILKRVVSIALLDAAVVSIQTVVLPESEDKRTYLAAAEILREGFAKLILIGTEETVARTSADSACRRSQKTSAL